MNCLTDPCSSKEGTPPANVACEIETDLIGPGINGRIFKKTDIESYPIHTVRIYNGWGVLVLRPPVTTTRAALSKGFRTVGITLCKNDELPVVVYFYIIDYVNLEEAKTKNG